MTIKEARVILLCNNVLELVFAQSKGVISEELLGNGEIDLYDLKKEAIKIVLNELDKQDTEINKLKRQAKFAAMEFEKSINLHDKVIDELIKAFKQDDVRSEVELREYFYKKAAGK